MSSTGGDRLPPLYSGIEDTPPRFYKQKDALD